MSDGLGVIRLVLLEEIVLGCIDLIVLERFIANADAKLSEKIQEFARNILSAASTNESGTSGVAFAMTMLPTEVDWYAEV